MKEKIKHLLGWLKCKINKIHNKGKRIYIGVRTKIVGGKYMKFGNDVKIRPDGYIKCKDTAQLIFEDKADVGCRCRICSENKIIIGKSVLFGPNVFLSDHNHQYEKVGIPIIEQGVRVIKGEGISIGEGSWLGINSAIIGNVKIGKGCVIGANSVVSKDVPDYCVVAGAPAKIIKRYNQKNKMWEKRVIEL